MTGSGSKLDGKMMPAKFALAIAVIAISFAALFFRGAAPTHPLIQAAVRLSIASILLLPWLIRAWGTAAFSSRVARAGVVCGFWYAVHFGAWVTSLTMTTVTASVTLVTATPLVLGVIGWLTGVDAPRKREWVGLGLGALGILIIGWDDLTREGSAWQGDLLALLGALGMAGYLLACRKVAQGLNVLAFTSLATGVAALLLSLGAFLADVPFAVPGWKPFLYLLAAALFPQMVGHVLLTWASRTLTPVVVGTATLGEPIGAAILAFFWLSEVPSTGVVIGSVVTLSGLLVALRVQRRGKTE